MFNSLCGNWLWICHSVRLFLYSRLLYCSNVPSPNWQYTTFGGMQGSRFRVPEGAPKILRFFVRLSNVNANSDIMINSLCGNCIPKEYCVTRRRNFSSDQEVCFLETKTRVANSEFGVRGIITTNCVVKCQPLEHLLASQYTLRVCKGPGFEFLEVHQKK